ncbi:MAG: transcriptional regulator, TetR family [Marmoricola sp.]|nr:transcriptional regulator, TetR family [Marmoricola sp.]MCW2838319.1 transcriptional regulator, TetR family [Marmoricola sp.]
MTTVSSLTYEDLGSAAQRDRRRRILDATVTLASRGGFDAVQMRAVADQADVALGTLYRYFPSKIHLLVSALAQQFEETEATLGRRTIPGDDPADRVTYVLTRATRGLQREPHLTEALTRAFMFADSTVSGEIRVVGRRLTSMLTRALQGDQYVEDTEPTDREIAVARVISDVWLASLVAWVTGRITAEQVTERLETAVELILR